MKLIILYVYIPWTIVAYSHVTIAFWIQECKNPKEDNYYQLHFYARVRTSTEARHCSRSSQRAGQRAPGPR